MTITPSGIMEAWKTEAWFVIAAKPGAEVALGFKEEISPKRFRDSARRGKSSTFSIGGLFTPET